MDNNQARVQQMLRSRRAGDAQGRAALKKPAAVVPQRDNAAGGNWRSGLVYAYPPGAGVLGGGRGGVGIVLHYRRDTGGYKSLNANDVRLTPLKTQGVKRVFLKFLKQKALPLDLVKHIFSLPVDNLQPAHVERWMAMIAIGGGPGASVGDVQQYLLEIRKKLLSRQGVADIAYQIFRSITDLRASMLGFLNIQGLYAQVSPEYHFAAVLGDLMERYLDLERLFWVKKTLVNLKGGGLLERAQAWKYTFKNVVHCPADGDVIAAFGAALSKNASKKNAYNKHLEGGEFARLKKYSQRVGEVLAQLVRYFGAKYEGAKSNTDTKRDLALELEQLISRTGLLKHPMYRICRGFEALQADTGVLPALRQLMVQSESEVSSRAAMAAVATQYVRGANNTCVAWPVAPQNGNGKNGDTGNGNGTGNNGATSSGNGTQRGTAKTASQNAAGASSNGSGNARGPQGSAQAPVANPDIGSSSSSCRCELNTDRGKNNDTYVIHRVSGECNNCFFFVVMKALGYTGDGTLENAKPYLRLLNETDRGKNVQGRVLDPTAMYDPLSVLFSSRVSRQILFVNKIRYVVRLVVDNPRIDIEKEFKKNPIDFINKLPRQRASLGYNYFDGIQLLDGVDCNTKHITREQLTVDAFLKNQVITFVLQNLRYSVFLPKEYRPKDPFGRLVPIIEE
tara:strand:- start:110 stop:2143 length:2034 start_codon:yes stop_codon:yes gene_type:complete